MESQKSAIYSTMFRWEPKEHYYPCTQMSIAHFWFSMEHCWRVITAFWFSADDINYLLVHECLNLISQNLYIKMVLIPRTMTVKWNKYSKYRKGTSIRHIEQCNQLLSNLINRIIVIKYENIAGCNRPATYGVITNHSFRYDIPYMGFSVIQFNSLLLIS